MPLWYLTEHLFVCLDPERPGGIFLAERWVPIVRFGLAPDGQLSLAMSSSTTAPAGSVVCDLGSLIRSGEILDSTYDPATRLLVARRQKSAGEIRLAKPPVDAVFSVSGMTIKLAAGETFSATQIAVGDAASPPTAVTRAMVEGLGLPLRVQAEGRETPFQPQPELTQNPLYRVTAKRLATLFADELRILDREPSLPTSAPATAHSVPRAAPPLSAARSETRAAQASPARTPRSTRTPHPVPPTRATPAPCARSPPAPGDSSPHKRSRKKKGAAHYSRKGDGGN